MCILYSGYDKREKQTKIESYQYFSIGDALPNITHFVMTDTLIKILTIFLHLF